MLKKLTFNTFTVAYLVTNLIAGIYFWPKNKKTLQMKKKY